MNKSFGNVVEGKANTMYVGYGPLTDERAIKNTRKSQKKEMKKNPQIVYGEELQNDGAIAFMVTKQDLDKYDLWNMEQGQIDTYNSVNGKSYVKPTPEHMGYKPGEYQGN